MKKTIIYFVYLLLFLFLLPTNVIIAEVIHAIDFTKEKDGDAVDWLKSQGFEFKLDADDLILRFENNQLTVATNDEISGLLMKEIQIKEAKRVRVEWGVIKYPKGADWEKGILREPIGIVVSFGKKKISSGSFIVPNAPYFITLILSDTAVEGKAYAGNYYKEGGRYFCIACRPPTGKTVITEFNLHQAFLEQFKENSVPAISAVAIEADSSDTEGVSKAFIKKIEFLSE